MSYHFFKILAGTAYRATATENEKILNQMRSQGVEIRGNFAAIL